MKVDFSLEDFEVKDSTPQFNMKDVDPEGNRLRITRKYLEYNGKPMLPVMGEMHFSRYPAEFWEESILKMKMNGINIIATYVFWIHHEEIKGQFNWEGNRNLRKFVLLCKKHDLWVHLRIGPFCHGEVRNGGIPDWIWNNKYKRTNHPKWLFYTEILYEEIGKQVNDLIFSKGGPIIAIQLENEYQGGQKGIPYIKSLKELARKSGLNTPYYTVTGWGESASVLKNETLPVTGGYATWPWSWHRRKIRPDEGSHEYMFEEADYANVDMEIFDAETESGGEETTKTDIQLGSPHQQEEYIDYSQYPRFTCEVGTGIQYTHHRRPILTTDDVVAMSYVKVGSGVNLIGYYMFHGGSNPNGENTYLNEIPKRPGMLRYPKYSYDFQAAIREFGQLNESYNHYRIFHYFINSFGHLMAPMDFIQPNMKPKDRFDVNTPRVGLRTDGHSGFLFVNNHDRHNDEMIELKNVQFEIKSEVENFIIPSESFSIPKSSYFVWPVNMDIDGKLLKYATVQPLTVIKQANEINYYFYQVPDIPIEMLFEGEMNIIKTKNAETMSKTQFGNDTLVKMDITKQSRLFALKGNDGNLINIIILAKEDALCSWIINKNDKMHLIISNNNFFQDSDKLIIRNKNDGYFQLENTIKLERQEAKESTINRYSCELPEKSLRLQYKIVKSRFRTKTWELNLPNDLFEHVNDVFLKIDFIGDEIRLLIDDELIWDGYWIGSEVSIGLKRWKKKLKQSKFYLEITPFTRIRKKLTYMDYDWQFPKWKWKIIELKSIELIPEYQIELLMNE